MRILSIAISLLVLQSWSCKTQEVVAPAVPENYEQSIVDWRANRLSNLLSPQGWLSLVGLDWLKEGVNNCGSSEDADIKLPYGAPATAAVFTLKDGKVSCDPAVSEGVQLLDAQYCQMGYGSFQWQLLERGGRYGVRVRDTLMPTRIRIQAIDHFPIDPAYRVYGHWQADAGADSLLMRNVLDMEYYVAVHGKLRFTIGKQAYELIALDGGPDDLFLIFADDTTGETTYGGGRYLYCSRPDENGQTIIDFNKAYNPPCAFTAFATCLLPRPENTLSIPILAGEKTYGEH